MHLSNNADPSGSGYEWTMARYGDFSDTFCAWRVHTDGIVVASAISFSVAIRPIFYLNSDVTLKRGTGIITDPYIMT